MGLIGRRFQTGELAPSAHAMLSLLGSAALVGMASAGMGLTTESRWICLLVEPFSLLFIPGVGLAIMIATIVSHLNHRGKSFEDNHDFTATLVVWCTFLFYAIVLYLMQSWRLRRAAQAINNSSR